jgi:hypothetical protein
MPSLSGPQHTNIKMKYLAALGLFLGTAVATALPSPELPFNITLDERGDSGCFPLYVPSVFMALVYLPLTSLAARILTVALKRSASVPTVSAAYDLKHLPPVLFFLLSYDQRN